ALDHLLLQGRGADQRIEHESGPEIGEKIHVLAQAQQAALGLLRERQIVPFGSADRAEQHGIALQGALHRLFGQGRAVLVERRAADEVLGDIEAGNAALVEPFDDAPDLAHHLGTNAVAGKRENFAVGRHCASLRLSSQGWLKRRFPSKDAIFASFLSVRPISSSPSRRQCFRCGSSSKWIFSPSGRVTVWLARSTERRALAPFFASSISSSITCCGSLISSMPFLKLLL